ncbi:unnamed protein product [Heligmosomoides polygyrus]|uniref:DNA replication ATP-dependent helicase/nuclease n=1 Tax=Heligmosomoides polygyrus TaxID=6339 RepID=A0A3P8A2Z3_HELPZ|nr:unnamed protein product [Heligmosomoides polygyrus]
MPTTTRVRIALETRFATSIFSLTDQWAEIQVEPGTRIRLIGAQAWGNADWLLSNEHGVMIVAPDTLVPCTSIAGATWCSRKVVLNERFRGPTVANKAMLIGIIVHELFQAALRCKNPRRVNRSWLLRIWHANLGDDVIAQLAALRFTPSQFESELQPYLEVSSFSGAYLTLAVHDIEENIWVPQLGLKGKVDATVKVSHCTSKEFVVVASLTSGRIPDSFSLCEQVMLYSLMLSSRYRQPIVEGSLLYLKDGVTRGVQPRALEMKAIINQRNRLALHFSRLNPDSLPAPKTDPKFCDKCDHALVCSYYQVAIEQAGKSSELMSNFATSNTSHLSQRHKEYFNKWIRWIYSEWAEDQSRKGNCLKDLWKKSVEQRLVLSFSAVNINQSAFCPGNMCTVSTSTKPAQLFKATTITVRSDHLVDYKEIYHIDLYNSFSTYPTTLGNLVLLMGDDESSARQRELFIDLVPPSPLRSDVASLPASVRRLLSDSGLSNEQRDAVQASLLCSDYTLIEGFPGSGKTTTIVALLRCLLEMNCSVLLTANTHSALDNVMTKLRKFTDDSKMLRLGKSSSVRDAIADLTLESKLSGSEDDKYKLARKILKETPLVASTCHYVPRDVLFSWRKFDYCILDEASMVLEPVVLSALAAARRFVLVGDAHQLSPLVQSRKCALVLCLLLRSVCNVVFEFSSIVRLASNLFYDDRMVCANEGVAQACLADTVGFKVPASVEGTFCLVNSVDQFQGRDKSVIVWSLVWTQTSGRRCELLRDQRRVNVALTRAKHKLVLVGCAESMRSIDVMKRVVDAVTVVKL